MVHDQSEANESFEPGYERLSLATRIGPVVAAFLIGGFFGLPVGSSLKKEKIVEQKREDYYVQSLENQLVKTNRRLFEMSLMATKRQNAPMVRSYWKNGEAAASMGAPASKLAMR